MRRDYAMVGGVWPERVAPSTRIGSKLDRNASELVDIKDGGTWAPSKPICIGGKGLTTDNTAQIIGPVTTKPGYGGDKPQILLVDQWPTFSSARTRITTIPWTRTDAYQGNSFKYSTGGSVIQQSSLTIFQSQMTIGNHQIHDGATLVRASCSFRYIGPKPAAITNERFYILRYDAFTDASAAGMHTAGTVGGTTYAGDYGKRAVASVEEFYAGGNVVSVVYEPDRNNVIDKTNYFYAFGLELVTIAEVYAIKLEYTVPNMKWE